jgi:hypothetical protein
MFADSTLRRPPLPFRPPARPHAPGDADARASGDRSRGAIGAGRDTEMPRLDGAGVRAALPLGATWELIGLRALYGR